MLAQHFSHLYLEQDLENHEEAQALVEKFKRSKVVLIKRYQELFHRPRQDWRAQKASPKLILAKKHGAYLYRGSPLTPAFGAANFFYNTPMMNCAYDCKYCYLQGMYSSANIVMFLNHEDYFNSVDEELKRSSPLYLCLSYDTDLLAFEAIMPYCRKWIGFARKRPQLTLEIRTKSANFKSISDLEPADNVILAWTLSPPAVVKDYETKTPSFKARLENIRAALAAGWKLRLCFDPLILVPGWQEIYSNMVAEIEEEIDLQKVADFSLGVFRMSPSYFKNFSNINAASPLLQQRLQKTARFVSYSESDRQDLLNYMHAQLAKRVCESRIYCCQ